MPKALPLPLRIAVMIPIQVRCSVPGCLEAVDLHALPMQVPSIDGLIVLDGQELEASMPAGWKLGAATFAPAGLVLDPTGSRASSRGREDPPMPFCLCPAHQGAVVER